MSTNTTPISPTSPLKGSCFCHTLALTITSPPTSSYICHCTDCRRATGSSFAHNASFPEDAVAVHLSESVNASSSLRSADAKNGEDGEGPEEKGQKPGNGAEGGGLEVENVAEAKGPEEKDKAGRDGQRALREQAAAVDDPTDQPTTNPLSTSPITTLGDKTSGGVVICARCGSRMIMYVPARITSMQGKVIVPVGVIDGSERDERLRPEMEGYVGRREGWMGKMMGTGERERW